MKIKVMGSNPGYLLNFFLLYCQKLNFFLRNVFLTRYLHKNIVHFCFGIRYRTKTEVMILVVHYTVALYPILLKADASKKKYKQVFIYHLSGQQKSRLVELERCFEEAIGLHHGLCWLCENFLQTFSSMFWYCCSTEMQKR